MWPALTQLMFSVKSTGEQICEQKNLKFTQNTGQQLQQGGITPNIWCFFIRLQRAISKLAIFQYGPFGKKKIFNIVMAFSTLPELHLIIVLFYFYSEK